MKYLFLLIFSLPIFNNAQSIDYNLQKGFVAEGYDVVSYFSGTAEEGQQQYAYTYDGATYLFASEAHLETFKKNPKQFIPEYGGWCAYAMAKNGKKVKINPKSFEIRNDKLYLFYNAWGTNTLKKWQKDPETLRAEADSYWKKQMN